MPWKECHVMDERRRFVARLLEGEKMAPLCAAFRISRKTGDKIFDRYKDCVQYYEERHREQQIRVIKKRAATLARWTELLSEYRHRRNCGFQRSLVMLAASNPSSGPRLSEFELHELTNAQEIAPVVSDENASRLAA